MEINNTKFQKLIEQYLSGDINSEELQQLINYYESFQKDDVWIDKMGEEKELKSKMLISILQSLEYEPETKTIPLYTKSFFKYAIAASIAFFAAINFYYYNQKNEIDLVGDSNVQIGGDKATLILANGCSVNLGNGKEYHSASVYSDGKKLIYHGEKDNQASKVSYNYLSVPIGGEFFVELADGTEVWLNSDSKIAFPENFEDGEKREVELIYGEAYFKVSPSSEHKGSRFVLKTGEQDIEVLGTQFNVKAYKEDTNIYTTLVEGVVKLNSTDSQSKNLVPGEQAIFSKQNKDLIISPVEISYEVSWKEGVFKFKYKNLEQIMTVLSRWYNVQVIYEDENLKEVKFNGQLRKDQELKDILELFKNTNFITNYEVKNNVVILK
ncbi:FecR family protein [Zunongwangia endophytica]|uniref:FecR family protein n=1 Tax=Zunongwangia endophytica TaxID=1808945 RepID=A0ABV8HEY9_9FLAO|nr:FecR family protein [Zunongwangia endophytica]MDN3593299.1 DUF4974 domain-containing protein [Zunongwangia endophytica]MDN3596919.1 DUF4974 domain-containing protein [Zunongwangia endophytica]